MGITPTWFTLAKSTGMRAATFQISLRRRKALRSPSSQEPSSASASDLAMRFPSGLPSHRSSRLFGMEVTPSFCEHGRGNVLVFRLLSLLCSSFAAIAAYVTSVSDRAGGGLVTASFASTDIFPRAGSVDAGQHRAF